MCEIHIAASYIYKMKAKVVALSEYCTLKEGKLQEKLYIVCRILL